MPVRIDGELWVTQGEIRELAREKAGVELGQQGGTWQLMASKIHEGEHVYPLKRIEARIDFWMKSRGGAVAWALKFLD